MLPCWACAGCPHAGVFAHPELARLQFRPRALPKIDGCSHAGAFSLVLRRSRHVRDHTKPRGAFPQQEASGCPPTAPPFPTTSARVDSVPECCRAGQFRGHHYEACTTARTEYNMAALHNSRRLVLFSHHRSPAPTMAHRNAETPDDVKSSIEGRWHGRVCSPSLEEGLFCGEVGAASSDARHGMCTSPRSRWSQDWGLQEPLPPYSTRSLRAPFTFRRTERS